MNLNELKPTIARRSRKRVGRGESSGYGKFSGRGNNGQRSRSGGSINPSFEGGQTPYFRRIPKKGFSNYPFKKSFSVINLSDIEMKYSDGETVNRETLISKNILKRKSDLIKILALGSFTKKVKFDVDKISDSAKDKIIKAGGEIVENVE
ncbi:MAG TPA: 50S ribosomal protein L15 [Fusobacteria bacterium]|nr:50S ribosomal protein L15 [Fusobacteriota bacterium]|tara:strand:- start:1335 stop:1784 length:450 start_codon:yes stop_codon:yes gene_type:complete